MTTIELTDGEMYMPHKANWLVGQKSRTHCSVCKRSYLNFPQHVKTRKHQKSLIMNREDSFRDVICDSEDDEFQKILELAKDVKLEARVTRLVEYLHPTEESFKTKSGKMRMKVLEELAKKYC